MSEAGTTGGAGSLAGRVAIVTGAAHGIGRGIAERLALDGAAVVIADVDQDAAAEAAGAIEASGGRAAAVRCDVRHAGDTDAMVAAAESAFGSLDILVTNAGIVRGKATRTMTDEEWDLVLDVILRGAFNSCRSAARLLLRDGVSHHRKVIGISSVAGVHGGQTVNYSAAKAGVIGLAKALAREWAGDQVNVNVIAPGRVAGTRIGWERDEHGKPTLERNPGRPQPDVPIGRVGTPDDVASLAAFLASPESDYLTGQVIELHGGREFMGSK